MATRIAVTERLSPEIHFRQAAVLHKQSEPVLVMGQFQDEGDVGLPSNFKKLLQVSPVTPTS
jgi:hypothetical protein